MTDKRPDTDCDAALLEPFFEAGRAAQADVSPALLARVLEAADHAADGSAVAAPRPVPWSVSRLKDRLEVRVRALGGWPALAGMAAVSIAGLWLGLTAPVPLTPEADYAVDLAPGQSVAIAGGFW